MSRWRRRLPWLLGLPFAALLWVPLYNRVEPRIAGFPFFYVWLLGWIVVTACLTWLVLRGRRA